MCGRFTLNPGKDFYDRFNLHQQLQFSPINNLVNPGVTIPIITHDKINLVWLMKWGLIPFWAKDEKIGRNLFNARAETVSEKPAFRKAFKSQRCLVPSNGFFEWKVEGNKKVPYYFEVENRPLFAYAGIYDIWEEPVGGKQVYTFTIITTTPNHQVKPIHDRMPVILETKNEKIWLDQSIHPESLVELLKPSLEHLNVKQYKF